MKTPFLVLTAGLFIPVAAALAAGPTIPQRQPQEAYQKMTEDWPFALATPPVAVVKAVDGWWTNYYIGGLGRNIVNGKEEVFVAVKPKNGEASFSLYGNEPGFDQISIANIEWSEEKLKSRVTLKKGTEVGTIEFDQAGNLVPAAQPNMPPRPGGMPNLPGMKQPAIRPPGAVVPRPTNMPQPVPQAPGVPLPGGPSNTNAPSNTNGLQNNGLQNQPANPKQRVRVIKSTP